MTHLRPLAYGVLVFVVVLIAALAIAWAAGAEYDELDGADYTVDGETQNASVGSWTALNPPTKASYFYDNETVTNSTGTQLTEGTDYEFNASGGSLTYFNTQSVTDGEEMTVDYAYAGPSPGSRSLFGVISIPIDYVLPAGLLISMAMTIVGLSVALYRFGDWVSGQSAGRSARR